MAKATGLPPSTAGGYFAGSNLPPPGASGPLPAILRACEITDAATIDLWVDTLNRIRRRPGPRAGDAPVPYRGLACYEPADADWYFGREALTATLVARVEALRDRGGVLAVVGPSGAGKSSLLRAGLVPAVCADDAHGLFVPGDHPGAELDAHLDGGFPPILVVDQVEEIFLAGIADAERDDFLARLIELAEANRTVVVLGMRADVYATALRHPLLAPILQDGQLIVSPMGTDDLRRAITGPAAKARLDIEDGLVELLLNELDPYPARAGGAAAAHDAGVLPLLSHALLATWQRSTRGRLTVADYQASGGVTGAITQSAEAVYDALTPDERYCARRVFLRLVRITADTIETRRRVPREALPSGPSTEPVFERFIRQRLITADSGALSISHDAVLRAWPRLREWIDADRGEGLIGQRVCDAADSWADSGTDPADLYRGARLSGAVEWLAGHADDASALVRSFVDASVRHERRRIGRLRRTIAALASLLVLATLTGAVALQQRAAARHQRDLALSRLVAGRADRIRGRDSALAAQLSLVAYRIAPTVEARSSLLDSSASFTPTRLRAGTGVLQSVGISAAGVLAAGGSDRRVRLWDTHDSRYAGPPAAVLPATGDTIYSVAFSPDGRTLAVGSGDAEVRLWDVRDIRHPVPRGPALHGPAKAVYSVAFSPDGHTLAAGSADRNLYLWDVRDPRHPRGIPPLTGFAGYVQTVAFSPDGRTLAGGGTDHTVRLWRVENPRHARALGRPLTGPSKSVFGLTFAPGSRTLAAGSADGTTHLWAIDRHGHAKPAGPPLAGATSWINTVAFARDGGLLATGSSDGTLRVYDARTHATIARLPHPGPVTAIAFGPGDRTIITSAADGTVRIWHIPGPVLLGEPDQVSMLEFRPDGRALVAGSADTRIWGAPSNRPLSPSLPNSARFATSVGYAPGGRTIAVGDNGGRLHLWDVTDPSRPRRLGPPVPAHRLNIEDVTFSPDGRYLATAGDDNTAKLFDVRDLAHPSRVATLTGFRAYVASVAFTPDGRTLATGGIDGSVRLWDVRDPARPRQLSEPIDDPRSYVYSVAFSPDGRTLASGDGDHTVRLWNVADPARPRPLAPPLTGPTNYVYSVAFGAGHRLAAADTSGSVWLWDLSDRHHPARLAELTADHGALFSVAFTGQTLASAGDARTIWLWNTDPNRVAADICATAGDPITRDEWRTYVPDITYTAPCGPHGPGAGD